MRSSLPSPPLSREMRDWSLSRRPRILCATSRGTAKKRAARRRRLTRARLTRASPRRPDADPIRQALGVDAPDQLDGDVHVSIGSAGDHRRRQVVALHHSKRVAALAKSKAEMWLRTDFDLIGVDANQQHDIGCPPFRTAASERLVNVALAGRRVAV